MLKWTGRDILSGGKGTIAGIEASEKKKPASVR